MQRGAITTLAKTVGVSRQYLWMILNGKRRPSYDLGKKLAETTNTQITLWMEGGSTKKSKATEAWCRRRIQLEEQVCKQN